jgi:hypothetical protein
MQQVYTSYISPQHWLEVLPTAHATLQHAIQTGLKPSLAQRTFVPLSQIPNLQTCTALLAVTKKVLQVHANPTSLTKTRQQPH